MNLHQTLRTRTHDHVYCPCNDCRAIRLEYVRGGHFDPPDGNEQRCTRCGSYDLWTLMERHVKMSGEVMELCGRCAEDVG